MFYEKGIIRISLFAVTAISIAAFTMSQNRPHAIILENICVQCGACMEECPVGAIKSDGTIYYIDERVCIGCGRCMDLCPVGAIWMKQFD